MGDITVSVIVCSRGPAKSIAINEHYHALGIEDVHIMRDYPSMAAGYNAGVKDAKGDVLIFSHDDVTILGPDLTRNLKRYFDEEAWDCDVIGVAGTSRLVGPGWIMAGHPYIHGQAAHAMPGGYSCCLYGQTTVNAQALDGLFIACRREVAEKIDWDERFGFHHYDLDWSYRAHLAGFTVAVVNDLPIIHASGGNFFSEGWAESAKLFMANHGATLPPNPNRKFQFAAVEVVTRDEVREIFWGSRIHLYENC